MAAVAARSQAMFDRADAFAVALKRDLERCAAIQAAMARELAAACPRLLQHEDVFAMEENETAKQTLERLGADKVRILPATRGLPQHLMNEASSWLAQLDKAERERSAALALSTKKAAWIAAIAAIIGVVIAIFSWAFPRSML